MTQPGLAFDLESGEELWITYPKDLTKEIKASITPGRETGTGSVGILHVGWKALWGKRGFIA